LYTTEIKYVTIKPFSQITEAELIAKHYSAAIDSVNLINNLVARATLTDQDKDTINRNVEHLNIMLSRDFWTTEDLQPFRDAVTAGNAKIA